jgi:uncharacterized membrane protein (UPF0127 family)
MEIKKVSFSYKGKEITVYAKVCKSLSSQILGKMFNLSKRPLLFAFENEQSIAIHMLFVFMPLQVIWLDRRMNVTKAKKMKPFISFEEGNAKYILEIPTNFKENKNVLSYFND